MEIVMKVVVFVGAVWLASQVLSGLGFLVKWGIILVIASVIFKMVM